MVKLASAIQYGVVALTLIICGLYVTTQKVGDVEVAIGMINEGGNGLEYLANLGYDISTISTASAAETISGLRSMASGLFTNASNSGAIWGLTAVMTLLPIALFIIAWVVIKRKYIISEEMYEDILRQLKERKEKENLAS